MAGKRYYWLKLKSDFFESKQMKKLRKIASGATYLIVYLKLQLLSLKTDGKLYFDGVEDTFAEELALEINESVDDVKMTIAFLQKFGLLEAESETEIFLPIVPTLVGKEDDRTDEIKEQTRQRVARHREKKKLEQGNASVTLPVTLPVTGGNALEIEKEKDIDIEREKEAKSAASVTAIIKDFGFSDQVSESFGHYLSYLAETGRPVGDEVAKAITRKLAEMTKSDSEAVEIFEAAIRNGWKDIYKLEKTQCESKKKPATGAFGRYDQRDFDYSDIEKKIRGYGNE